MLFRRLHYNKNLDKLVNMSIINFYLRYRLDIDFLIYVDKIKMHWFYLDKASR